MNPHDRGIEDLLKLLERDEPSGGEDPMPAESPSSAPQSPSLGAASLTTQGRTTRQRTISFSFLSKDNQVMRRASSGPLAQTAETPTPPLTPKKPLGERRIYSSDSLPTAISQRVFLQNADSHGQLPLFLPDQRRMNYASEGHFGSLLSKESPLILQNLRRLVNTLNPAIRSCSPDQRKRLFYVIEAINTEFVYVQVLEVLASVFVQPLYQALSDKAPIISLYEMQAIFSTLVDAPKHHIHFLLLLQQRLETWTDKSTIGDVFVEHVWILLLFFPSSLSSST